MSFWNSYLYIIKLCVIEKSFSASWNMNFGCFRVIHRISKILDTLNLSNETHLLELINWLFSKYFLYCEHFHTHTKDEFYEPIIQLYQFFYQSCISCPTHLFVVVGFFLLLEYFTANSSYRVNLPINISMHISKRFYIIFQCHYNIIP
jgi:hypothetical protein